VLTPHLLVFLRVAVRCCPRAVCDEAQGFMCLKCKRVEDIPALAKSSTSSSHAGMAATGGKANATTTPAAKAAANATILAGVSRPRLLLQDADAAPAMCKEDEACAVCAVRLDRRSGMPRELFARVDLKPCRMSRDGSVACAGGYEPCVGSE
jgi:hypothetical protein